MILLFFFRFITRTKLLDSGRFYCNDCGQERHYQRVELRRWFCFFLIPLIPSRKSVLVKCSGCSMLWNPDVLKQPFARGPALLTADLLRRLIVSVLGVGRVPSPAQRESARSIIERAMGRPYGASDLEADLIRGPGIVGADLATRKGEVEEATAREFIGSAASVAYAGGVPDRAQLEALYEAGHTLGLSDGMLRSLLTSVAHRSN